MGWWFRLGPGCVSMGSPGDVAELHCAGDLQLLLFSIPHAIVLCWGARSTKAAKPNNSCPALETLGPRRHRCPHRHPPLCMAVCRARVVSQLVRRFSPRMPRQKPVVLGAAARRCGGTARTKPVPFPAATLLRARALCAGCQPRQPAQTCGTGYK